MKQKTVWMLAGGLAGAVALMAWAFASRPPEVEVATVAQGRFEATIEEDARTRLRDRYVVSAPLAGRLARPALRDGDRVAAGAVVASLQPVLPALLDERTLAEQRARVDAALAQVQRAAARVAAAAASAGQAQAELRRSEQLARDGFVSPTRLDAERLAAQVAQKEHEAALADRRAAEQGVLQARAALAAVQAGPAGAGAFAVRAPIDGQVLRMLQTSEATVATGTPLVELGDTRRLEVVAELLTTDALRAVPGSAVRIERWGGAGTLDGRVRMVEPAAFTKVSALGVEEQRVEVLIDITSPPERWAALGDGYRVGVRVLVEAADAVVKVPAAALFPVPGGAPGAMAVFVLREGRAVQQPVQLGGRHGAEAWVREGLRAGEQVVIYPGSAVRDGARVKVRST
ncbi:efflux RND transporter periplasmic adaptor subunit [Ideonella sp.]|uniref:efflux RND transporter periplasmic adaptor subunit n=1 Tax=Ideonella sp. TaxID=1929293 RepID=UPI0035AF52E7